MHKVLRVEPSICETIGPQHFIVFSHRQFYMAHSCITFMDSISFKLTWLNHKAKILTELVRKQPVVWLIKKYKVQACVHGNYKAEVNYDSPSCILPSKILLSESYRLQCWENGNHITLKLYHFTTLYRMTKHTGWILYFNMQIPEVWDFSGQAIGFFLSCCCHPNWNLAMHRVESQSANKEQLV